MTADRYTHDDALWQAIKALLVRHVEDNEDDWIDGDSFTEVSVRLTASELNATDDFTLSLEVPDALDPDARVVTLKLIRRQDD